jgi:hypothetical protein
MKMKLQIIMFFALFLLVNCEKNVMADNINEPSRKETVKKDDYEIYLEQHRKNGYISDIITRENSFFYDGVLHGIYFYLTRNDCTIMVITNITDMESGWAPASAEEYLVLIRNNKLGIYLESEWIYSRPSPSFYWLDDTLFRMDFGSKVGPDSHSYFYSNKSDKISQDFFLATAFVDIKNQLILCADEKLIIYSIFSPNNSQVLEEPSDMINAAMKWFIVGNNTKFTNDNKLILDYLNNTDTWGYSERVYNLKCNLIIK